MTVGPPASLNTLVPDLLRNGGVDPFRPGGPDPTARTLPESTDPTTPVTNSRDLPSFTTQHPTATLPIPSGTIPTSTLPSALTPVGGVDTFPRYIPPTAPTDVPVPDLAPGATPNPGRTADDPTGTTFPSPASTSPSSPFPSGTDRPISGQAAPDAGRTATNPNPALAPDAGRRIDPVQPEAPRQPDAAREPNAAQESRVREDADRATTPLAPQPITDPVHPEQWRPRQAAAPVAVVHTEIPGPGAEAIRHTEPDGTPEPSGDTTTSVHAEVRRVQADDGRWVRSLTVDIPVRPGPGLTADDLADLRERGRALLDAQVNHGLPLPRSGDQLHIDLNVTDAPGADGAVQISASERPAPSGQWHIHLHADDPALPPAERERRRTANAATALRQLLRHAGLTPTADPATGPLVTSEALRTVESVTDVPGASDVTDRTAADASTTPTTAAPVRPPLESGDPGTRPDEHPVTTGTSTGPDGTQPPATTSRTTKPTAPPTAPVVVRPERTRVAHAGPRRLVTASAPPPASSAREQRRRELNDLWSVLEPSFGGGLQSETRDRLYNALRLLDRARDEDPRFAHPRILALDAITRMVLRRPPHTTASARDHHTLLEIVAMAHSHDQSYSLAAITYFELRRLANSRRSALVSAERTPYGRNWSTDPNVPLRLDLIVTDAGGYDTSLWGPDAYALVADRDSDGRLTVRGRPVSDAEFVDLVVRDPYRPPGAPVVLLVSDQEARNEALARMIADGTGTRTWFTNGHMDFVLVDGDYVPRLAPPEPGRVHRGLWAPADPGLVPDDPGAGFVDVSGKRHLDSDIIWYPLTTTDGKRMAGRAPLTGNLLAGTEPALRTVADIGHYSDRLVVESGGVKAVVKEGEPKPLSQVWHGDAEQTWTLGDSYILVAEGAPHFVALPVRGLPDYREVSLREAARVMSRRKSLQRLPKETHISSIMCEQAGTPISQDPLVAPAAGQHIANWTDHTNLASSAKLFLAQAGGGLPARVIKFDDPDNPQKYWAKLPPEPPAARLQALADLGRLPPEMPERAVRALSWVRALRLTHGHDIDSDPARRDEFQELIEGFGALELLRFRAANSNNTYPLTWAYVWDITHRYAARMGQEDTSLTADLLARTLGAARHGRLSLEDVVGPNAFAPPPAVRPARVDSTELPSPAVAEVGEAVPRYGPDATTLDMGRRVSAALLAQGHSVVVAGAARGRVQFGLPRPLDAVDFHLPAATLPPATELRQALEREIRGAQVRITSAGDGDRVVELTVNGGAVRITAVDRTPAATVTADGFTLPAPADSLADAALALATGTDPVLRGRDLLDLVWALHHTTSDGPRPTMLTDAHEAAYQAARPDNAAPTLAVRLSELLDTAALDPTALERHEGTWRDLGVTEAELLSLRAALTALADTLRTTPEVTADPVRALAAALPGLSAADRTAALAGLSSGDRERLAAAPALADALREKLSRADFVVTAADLMTQTPSGVERLVAVRHLARDQVARLMPNPKVAARLLKAGSRVVVVPRDQAMTSLDAFRDLRGLRSADGRPWESVRGASVHSGPTAVTEENLLGEQTTVTTDASAYPDGYSTTVHEIAHSLHQHGLSAADRRLVTKAYNATHQKGESGAWPDGPLYSYDDGHRSEPNYSSRDEDEFFAQLTNVYFRANGGTDPYTGLPRANGGPEWVRKQQPKLYRLLKRLYGKNRPTEPVNPPEAADIENEALALTRALWDAAEGRPGDGSGAYEVVRALWDGTTGGHLPQAHAPAPNPAPEETGRTITAADAHLDASIAEDDLPARTPEAQGGDFEERQEPGTAALQALADRGGLPEWMPGHTDRALGWVRALRLTHGLDIDSDPAREVEFHTLIKGFGALEELRSQAAGGTAPGILTVRELQHIVSEYAARMGWDRSLNATFLEHLLNAARAGQLRPEHVDLPNASAAPPAASPDAALDLSRVPVVYDVVHGNPTGRDFTGDRSYAGHWVRLDQVHVDDGSTYEDAEVPPAPAPWGPNPWLVLGQLTQEGLVTPAGLLTPDGVTLGPEALAALLAPDLAALPPDVPIVLPSPGAANFTHLDFPRALARATNRVVWVPSGDGMMVPRGEGPVYVPALLDFGPDHAVGAWVPVHPAEGGEIGLNRRWTDLDGTEFTDSDVVSRPVVSDAHLWFGLVATAESGEGAREVDRELRQYQQLRRLARFVDHPEGLQLKSVERHEPEDPAVHRAFDLLVHGVPGGLALLLRDGRDVTLSAEDGGRYLGGLPTVQALPEDYHVNPVICYGASAGDPRLPQPYHQPPLPPDDLLRDQPLGQHLANSSGRRGRGVTVSIGIRTGALNLIDPARGAAGAFVDFRPEPEKERLGELAVLAGLHSGDGEVPTPVLDTTLLLVRAVGIVYGTEVETHPDYPNLIKAVGALERLRAQDPRLSALTPFRMDLWKAVAYHITIDPRRANYSEALRWARETLLNNPRASLSTVLNSRLLNDAVTRIEGNPDLVRDVLRALYALREPAPQLDDERRTARALWALHTGLGRLNVIGPDVESYGRRVLHLPPWAEWTRDHHQELLLLLAQGAAADLDINDADIMGALHLVVLGAFDPAHELAHERKFAGFNWSGNPTPNGIDLRWFARLFPKPDGDTEITWEAYPWIADDPRDQGRFLVFWTDVGPDGRIALHLPGGVPSVSDREFAVLLDLLPKLRSLPLSAPIGLLTPGHTGLSGAVAARTWHLAYSFIGGLLPVQISNPATDPVRLATPRAPREDQGDWGASIPPVPVAVDHTQESPPMTGPVHILGAGSSFGRKRTAVQPRADRPVLAESAELSSYAVTYGALHDGHVGLVRFDSTPGTVLDGLYAQITGAFGVSADTREAAALHDRLATLLTAETIDANRPYLRSGEGHRITVRHAGRDRTVDIRLAHGDTRPSERYGLGTPAPPDTQVEYRAVGSQTYTAGESSGNNRTGVLSWTLHHPDDSEGALRWGGFSLATSATHNELTQSVTVGETFQITSKQFAKDPAQPLDLDARWQIRLDPQRDAHDGWLPERSHGTVTAWFPRHRAIGDTDPAGLPEPAALDDLPLWGVESVKHPRRLYTELLEAPDFAALLRLNPGSAQALEDFLSEPFLRGTTLPQTGGGVYSSVLSDTDDNAVGVVRLIARVTPGLPSLQSPEGRFSLETYLGHGTTVEQSVQLGSGVGLDAGGGPTFTTDHPAGHPDAGTHFGGGLQGRIGGAWKNDEVLTGTGTANLVHGTQTTGGQLHTPATVGYDVILYHARGGETRGAFGPWPDGLVLLVPPRDVVAGQRPHGEEVRALPERLEHLDSIGYAEVPVRAEGAALTAMLDRAQAWLRTEGFLPPAEPASSSGIRLDEPLRRAQLANLRRFGQLRTRIGFALAMPEAVDGGRPLFFEKPAIGVATRRVQLRLSAARDATRPSEHTRRVPGVHSYGSSVYEAGGGRRRGVAFGASLGGDGAFRVPVDPGVATMSFGPGYTAAAQSTRAVSVGDTTGLEQTFIEKDGSDLFTVPAVFRLDLYEGTGTVPLIRFADPGGDIVSDPGGAGDVLALVPAGPAAPQGVPGTVSLLVPHSFTRPAAPGTALAARPGHALRSPVTDGSAADDALRLGLTGGDGRPLPGLTRLLPEGSLVTSFRGTAALLEALSTVAAGIHPGSLPPGLLAHAVRSAQTALSGLTALPGAGARRFLDLARQAVPARLTGPVNRAGDIAAALSSPVFSASRASHLWAAAVYQRVSSAALGAARDDAGVLAAEARHAAVRPAQLLSRAPQIFGGRYVIEGLVLPALLADRLATVEIQGYLRNPRHLGSAVVQTEQSTASGDFAVQQLGGSVTHQFTGNLTGLPVARPKKTWPGNRYNPGARHDYARRTETVDAGTASTKASRIPTHGGTHHLIGADATLLVTVRHGVRNVLGNTFGLGEATPVTVAVDLPHAVTFQLPEASLARHAHWFPFASGLTLPALVAPTVPLPDTFARTRTLGLGSVLSVTQFDDGRVRERRDRLGTELARLVEEESPGATRPGHSSYLPGVATEIARRTEPSALRALPARGAAGASFHFLHAAWGGARLVEVTLKAEPVLQTPALRGLLGRPVNNGGMEQIHAHTPHGRATTRTVTRTHRAAVVPVARFPRRGSQVRIDREGPAFTLAHQRARTLRNDETGEDRFWMGTGNTADFDGVDYTLTASVRSRLIGEWPANLPGGLLQAGILRFSGLDSPHAHGLAGWAERLLAGRPAATVSVPAATVLRFAGSETTPPQSVRAPLPPGLHSRDPLLPPPAGAPAPGTSVPTASAPRLLPTGPTPVFQFNGFAEVTRALHEVAPALTADWGLPVSMSDEAAAIRLGELIQAGRIGLDPPRAGAGLTTRMPGSWPLSTPGDMPTISLALYSPRPISHSDDVAVDRRRHQAQGATSTTTAGSSLGLTAQGGGGLPSDRPHHFTFEAPVTAQQPHTSSYGGTATGSSLDRLNTGRSAPPADRRGTRSYETQVDVVLTVEGVEGTRWVTGTAGVRLWETDLLGFGALTARPHAGVYDVPALLAGQSAEDLRDWARHPLTDLPSALAGGLHPADSAARLWLSLGDDPDGSRLARALYAASRTAVLADRPVELVVRTADGLRHWPFAADGTPTDATDGTRDNWRDWGDATASYDDAVAAQQQDATLEQDYRGELVTAEQALLSAGADLTGARTAHRQALAAHHEAEASAATVRETAAAAILAAERELADAEAAVRAAEALPTADRVEQALLAWRQTQAASHDAGHPGPEGATAVPPPDKAAEAERNWRDLAEQHNRRRAQLATARAARTDAAHALERTRTEQDLRQRQDDAAVAEAARMVRVTSGTVARRARRHTGRRTHQENIQRNLRDLRDDVSVKAARQTAAEGALARIAATLDIRRRAEGIGTSGSLLGSLAAAPADRRLPDSAASPTALITDATDDPDRAPDPPQPLGTASGSPVVRDRAGLLAAALKVIRRETARGLSVERCLQLLGALSEVLHPQGTRAATTLDDRAIGGPGPEGRLAPGPGWQRVPSWDPVFQAVRAAGPGTTAFILARRQGTALGHAWAAHHLPGGEVVWVDLAAPNARILSSEAPEIAAADARAVLIGPTGQVLPNALPPFPESSSTTHAILDAATERHHYAGLGLEVETPHVFLIQGMDQPYAKELLATGPGMQVVTDLNSLWSTADGRWHALRPEPRAGEPEPNRVTVTIGEFVVDPMASVPGERRPPQREVMGRLERALHQIGTVERYPGGVPLHQLLPATDGWQFTDSGARTVVQPATSGRLGSFCIQATAGFPVSRLRDLLDRATLPVISPGSRALFDSGRRYGQNLAAHYVGRVLGRDVTSRQVPFLTAIPDIDEVWGYAWLAYAHVGAAPTALIYERARATGPVPALVKNFLTVASRNPLDRGLRALRPRTRAFLAGQYAPLNEDVSAFAEEARKALTEALDWYQQSLSPGQQLYPGFFDAVPWGRDPLPRSSPREHLTAAFTGRTSHGRPLTQSETVGMDDYPELDTDQGHLPLPLLLPELRMLAADPYQGTMSWEQIPPVVDALMELTSHSYSRATELRNAPLPEAVLRESVERVLGHPVVHGTADFLTEAIEGWPQHGGPRVGLLPPALAWAVAEELGRYALGLPIDAGHRALGLLRAAVEQAAALQDRVPPAEQARTAALIASAGDALALAAGPDRPLPPTGWGAVIVAADGTRVRIETIESFRHRDPQGSPRGVFFGPLSDWEAPHRSDWWWLPDIWHYTWVRPGPVPGESDPAELPFAQPYLIEVSGDASGFMLARNDSSTPAVLTPDGLTDLLHAVDPVLTALSPDWPLLFPAADITGAVDHDPLERPLPGQALATVHDRWLWGTASGREVLIAPPGAQTPARFLLAEGDDWSGFRPEPTRPELARLAEAVTGHPGNAPQVLGHLRAIRLVYGPHLEVDAPAMRALLYGFQTWERDRRSRGHTNPLTWRELRNSITSEFANRSSPEPELPIGLQFLLVAAAGRTGFDLELSGLGLTARHHSPRAWESAPGREEREGTFGYGPAAPVHTAPAAHYPEPDYWNNPWAGRRVGGSRPRPVTSPSG
ncbi:lonely Cys domain-containing protein [Streptomyces sp. NPDC055078]